MSDPLARLEPRSVWEHFSAICRIPRPSGHEEKVAGYVRSVAGEHGFEVVSDRVGNLVVRVPARGASDGSAPVILQGHLDMVCEKNRDVEHDFLTDPIRPRVDGDWVYATGTTLGSDNGIGVAAALAAATDPSVVHGPLELLLTLDEETGLTGAQQLDASILTGRTMLNMDSEEDGVLFVGCAGGADTHLRLSVSRSDAPADSEAMRLAVGGLRGGHSGLNIHENRANAVKLLARLLDAARQAGISFRLVSVNGGSKHNAIPREAEAVVLVPSGSADAFRSAIDARSPELREEVTGIDDGLEVRLEAASNTTRALSESDADRLVRVLLALPHGVLGMSPAIPGLVETSSNLASVNPDGDVFTIVNSTRSSVMPSLDAVRASIRAVGEMAGAEVRELEGYPGWKPDLSSPVLGVMKEVYGELWGRAPEVTAIHAGLECGLIGEKVPGMDMVSFGPQIEGAHSPEERVSIASVDRFWRALREALGRLAA